MLSDGRTPPTLAPNCLALFIDESGNAQPAKSVKSLWGTAALAVVVERARELNGRIDRLRTLNFRFRLEEVKGSEVPRGLARGRSIDNPAKDLAAIHRELGDRIWVVAVRRQSDGLATKRTARWLVLERVNGFLNRGDYEPARWITGCDVSDVQELGDFSRNISEFRNVSSAEPRSDRLVPSVLGGTSHDWGGLQSADLLSN